MTGGDDVSLVDAIANIALMVAAAGALTFVVLYAGWSAWRSTLIGRAVMRFFAIIAAILTLVVLFEYWDTADERLIDWLSVILFSAMAVEMWRLVYVLIRTQRRERRERSEEDERNR